MKKLNLWICFLAILLIFSGIAFAETEETNTATAASVPAVSDQTETAAQTSVSETVINTAAAIETGTLLKAETSSEETTTQVSLSVSPAPTATETVIAAETGTQVNTVTPAEVTEAQISTASSTATAINTAAATETGAQVNTATPAEVTEAQIPTAFSTATAINTVAAVNTAVATETGTQTNTTVSSETNTTQATASSSTVTATTTVAPEIQPSDPSASTATEPTKTKADEKKEMPAPVTENEEKPVLKFAEPTNPEMAKNWNALFSKDVTPESVAYVVKRGDSLYVLALKNHTTVDLIKQINQLDGDTIYPGMKLKINTAPFSILVSKSKNTLTLSLNNKPIKEYSVATGKNNNTPVGAFKIATKLMNPTWFKTGAILPPGSPENALGTRWLGFDKPAYGIHGTIEPKSIGTQASEGCIRMLNEQVEELYSMIPIGTQVTVQD